MASRSDGPLEPPATLPEHLVPIWDQVAPEFHRRIGTTGLEAVCIQIHRLRDAQERITREGVLVNDPKGNAAPHPALDVERRASAEILKYRKEFAAR